MKGVWGDMIFRQVWGAAPAAKTFAQFERQFEHSGRTFLRNLQHADLSFACIAATKLVLTFL
jgi:hypothetical protein